ncbi:MAG: GAP family protein [Solirubrobacterales bacterium]|nr:GAP family protein [Solirubrobacterales bacterium]MBV9338221.1 GAP family protein [Solirubrobacterales bacterium]
MSTDVVTVLVSAVIATLNPSLLAAVTVMLLLPEPKRLMLGYLLGAYTSSITAGLVIIFSLHGTGVAKTSTHLLSPAGQIVVGVVALAVALLLATGRDAGFQSWRRRRKETRAAAGKAKDPWQVRMLGKGSSMVAFAVGAAMSFPGVSYVNALDHIANLNPPTISMLALVLYFCVMQQILLEGALLAYTFASDRTQNFIVTLKAWFARHGHQLTVGGFFAVGILLATRGALAIG